MPWRDEEKGAEIVARLKLFFNVPESLRRSLNEAIDNADISPEEPLSDQLEELLEENGIDLDRLLRRHPVRWTKNYNRFKVERKSANN